VAFDNGIPELPAPTLNRDGEGALAAEEVNIVDFVSIADLRRPGGATLGMAAQHWNTEVQKMIKNRCRRADSQRDRHNYDRGKARSDSRRNVAKQSAEISSTFSSKTCGLAYACCENADVKRVICERIAEGETLASKCRDPDFPDRSTVARWRDNDPEFDQQLTRVLRQSYVRARVCV
jgi:hypothetical protein